MGTNYNPRIVTDGLVLCLDAANSRSYSGSGTAWNDLSGNGNNGTLVNGPTFSSNNGGSLIFDGVNDSVDLGSISLIQNLTTNFTIEMLVRFTTSGGQYGIFKKNGTNQDGYTIYLRQGPQFSFLGTFTDETTTNIVTTPAGEISNNNWYHVVYTYNSVNIIGYVNSVQKVIANFTKAFKNNGGSSTIGADPSLGTAPRYWAGNISNVKIYNRALTAAEIRQNFEATRDRYGI